MIKKPSSWFPHKALVDSGSYLASQHRLSFSFRPYVSTHKTLLSCFLCAVALLHPSPFPLLSLWTASVQSSPAIISGIGIAEIDTEPGLLPTKKSLSACDCFHILVLEISRPTFTVSDSWDLHMVYPMAVIFFLFQKGTQNQTSRGIRNMGRSLRQ